MKVRVGVYYEVSGYTVVNAEDELVAENEVAETLEQDGIEALSSFTTTSRVFYVINSERVAIDAQQVAQRITALEAEIAELTGDLNEAGYILLNGKVSKRYE